MYECCQNGKRKQASCLCIVGRYLSPAGKKTFLMFFGSSQAISLLSSHIIIFCPAEEEVTKHRFPHRCPAVTSDYTQQYQTPSMPCTAQWRAVPMRSGETPQHWVPPTHSLICQGARALLSTSWGLRNHWKGGNSHIAWQTNGLRNPFCCWHYREAGLTLPGQVSDTSSVFLSAQIK